MLPVILAPILAKLAENGLNLIADAVTAKGKEFVEDKLGVNIEKSVQSEEGLLKLKQAEMDHQEFLIEAGIRQKAQELEEIKLADANTADARNQNVKIQESANASQLAKNAAYILDFVIVIATLTMAYTILFQSVPAANKEIFYTAFGSLLTLCGTIVNFHRGTSRTSAGKDDTINILAKGNVK